MKKFSYNGYRNDRLAPNDFDIILRTRLNSMSFVFLFCNETLFQTYVSDERRYKKKGKKNSMTREIGLGLCLNFIEKAKSLQSIELKCVSNYLLKHADTNTERQSKDIAVTQSTNTLLILASPNMKLLQIIAYLNVGIYRFTFHIPN